MKEAAWVTLFLLILLHASLGEAQKSSSSKLESRVAQMLEWNKRNSIIKLTSDKFNTYVKSKPRNYSVVAMLTALKPQRECSVCQDANDEYVILANSYHYSSAYSNRLFFVMVDIDEDGYEVFQWLRLTTAPTYYHFPPTGKRKPEDRFDVGRVGYQADALAKWVAERTSIQITIMRPPNYTMLTLWALVVIVVLVFAYWRRENLSIIYNSQNWAFLAILVILYMVSGQMWNHIRGPPVAHRNPHTGEVGYFSGTSQYQFVAETYIIMALYGSITVGVILMNKELSFPFIEGAIQKGSYMVGLAIVVLVFGYTLSIFRMKYQGYPYRIQSVRMTENRWNSIQAAEEYPRSDTSIIPGSTGFAGKDNRFSKHANNGRQRCPKEHSEENLLIPSWKLHRNVETYGQYQFKEHIMGFHMVGLAIVVLVFGYTLSIYIKAIHTVSYSSEESDRGLSVTITPAMELIIEP